MRMTILALLCFAPFGAGAPLPKDRNPKITIIGSWIAETQVMENGTERNALAGYIWTFEEDGKLSQTFGPGKPADPNYAFQHDHTFQPHRLDFSHTLSPNSPSSLAIYEIDGETLRFCYTVNGPRPKAFAGVDGKTVYYIMRRWHGK